LGLSAQLSSNAIALFRPCNSHFDVKAACWVGCGLRSESSGS